jgi:hypothetical protein
MEENQSFTSIDSLSVLALSAGVIVLVWSILANSLPDRPEVRAKKRSEQLAVQILANGLKASPESSQNFNEVRAPASLKMTMKLDIRPEGRIGMDPWGAPYFYRVFQDAKGRETVVVFSSGPNRRRDLVEEALSAGMGGPVGGQLADAGDDIVSMADAH